MSARLASQSYGKHRVRVSKVRRPRQAPPKEERHEFVEATVNIELEGDFDAAYTHGDNRLVVATDTCKNTVYVVAKDHPLDSIESFGLALSQHFLDTYNHVDGVTVTLEERVWSRLLDSPHSFVADQKATPTATVKIKRGETPRVTAGVRDLVIAKTTETGFADFHHSECRTLADTDDRILATNMTATWNYNTTELDFSAAHTVVTGALLSRFIDHYSRSVQETLYFMAEAALAACSEIQQITLALPNLHHLLANLAPFERENQNEVFVVTDEPHGYITATVTR